MHSTGMTWIQLWNSPVKIIPLILPEVPSHTDKGLSAKPGLEKRVQKNSKASPMFTMAMIVTGYPGIRDCLNAYREVKGCDLWEFEEDKTKRKDSYWKIVEGKDRTIFNLKGRSLNTGLLPYASVIT